MLPLRRWTAVGTVLSFGLAVSAQDPQPGTPAKPAEPDTGIKVAEQGPIHEGFAQPGAPTRGQDMVAPKAPPPPVPELPPDTKPAGNDVRWVPGYWMWEPEKKDFTWVSGFWRDVPPGQEWSVGEWKQQGNEYRYVPGFWKPTTMNQWRIDLPEPPKPLNTDPNTPAPQEGMTWVPGHWVYNEQTGQYQWRAGHWTSPPANNMVYQPPQYRATTYGYAYSPGYWDYPLENRGLLYAPVTFARPLWNNPGWAFQPQFALNLGYGSNWGNSGFFASLSIGNGFGNYYYGPFGSGWSFGLGLGVFPNYLYGPGFYPAWAGYAYRPFYPWWFTGGGYYNCLYKQYCNLNQNNPAYAAQVRQNTTAAALGMSPPVDRPNPNPASQALAGAASTTLKPNYQTARLVQPAQQVVSQQRTAAAANQTVTALKASPNSVAGVNTTNLPRGSSSPGSVGSGARQPFNPPVTINPQPSVQVPKGSPSTTATPLPSTTVPKGNLAGIPTQPSVQSPRANPPAISQGPIAGSGVPKSFNPPATTAPRSVPASPPVSTPRQSFNPPPAAAPRQSFNPPPAAAPRQSFNPPPAAAPRQSFNPPPAASPRPAAPPVSRPAAPPAGGSRGSRGRG